MHLSGTGRSTITLADVNVDEAVAETSNGFGGAFFFNVRVKAVEHGAKIRMIDLIHQSAGLRGGGQKIAFEPVQVFNRQLDLGFFRDFRRLAKNVGCSLFFIRRWTRSRKDRQGRMIRAA